jgi:hypothetical protein
MNPNLQKSVAIIRQKKNAPITTTSGAKITVNESIGRAAFYYEKFRNALDYQDEHSFLKNAIKRILKRRIVLYGFQDNTARVLLHELVWARYFENESLPESVIEEVASILRKFSFLKSNVQSKNSDASDIIIGLCACEIEETLFPHDDQEYFLAFVKQTMAQNIKLDESEISKIDLSFQIEISSRKMFFKSDIDEIRFRLFRFYYPRFPVISKTDAAEICEHFDDILMTFEAQLQENKRSKVFKYIKKNAPPFIVIWDLINRSPKEFESIAANKSMILQRGSAVIEDRNKNIFSRVIRALFRGIIFILLTKVFLAIAIELPYETKYLHQINYSALATNIILPPLVMIITGFFIKVPGKTNTYTLLEITSDILLQERLTTAKLLTLNSKRTMGHRLFNFSYTVLSLAILAAVVLLLIKLKFNIVSIGLFFVFISIVSFLAFRIRSTAKELEVKAKDDNVIIGIYNFVLLPFVIIGKVLSDKWSDYNFTLWFWDFIIEAPFKAIIAVFESWLSFVREKKEDFE